MTLQEEFGSWYTSLKPVLENAGFNQLGKILANEYKTKTICPNRKDLFKAFKLCNTKDFKVLILGQDPYHDMISKNVCRATGLAFANDSSSWTISPSLKNIHAELESDLDILNIDFDCSLEEWAKQGVLLLNTSLSVIKGKPTSHSHLWEEFTKRVLKIITLEFPDTIFVLWGKHAQQYESIIQDNHLGPMIIKSAHPSPFSAHKGFFGSKPFTQINKLLKIIEKKEIKWIN